MTKIQNFKQLAFDLICDFDIVILNLPALLNRHFGLYGICSECELNSQ
jgi:hypothetical protein